MAKDNNIQLHFIARRLNDFRKRNKISKSFIARKMRVKHPFVINILNTNIVASTDVLNKVAKILWMSDTEFKNIILQAKIYDAQNYAKVHLNLDI